MGVEEVLVVVDPAVMEAEFRASAECQEVVVDPGVDADSWG
jgi:hypothetical protein